LAWIENTPAFEQTVIDERGYPLTLVSPDPRAFAIHKFWLSRRGRRDPLKRARDEAQSFAVADMVLGYMQHLTFSREELRMIPLEIVNEALERFQELRAS
jgi:hypothetical protein